MQNPSQDVQAIYGFATRMTEMLKHGTSGKTLPELIERVRQNKGITSIGMLFPQSSCHEPRVQEYVQYPSSEYSSDCYDESERGQRITALSFMEAKNLLIDPSVFLPIENEEEALNRKNE